jgi:putative flippase GtrA
VRAVLKFWLVGAAGFVVQLATLAVLTSVMRWPWLPATIVAVESAIVHNFIWHQRWTWRSRFAGFTRLAGCSRFARFHVANGISSIIGNVIVTGLFIRTLHLRIVAANAIAVVVMSAINFAVADRWVFATLLLLVPASASAAPTPATLQAWSEYVARTEARIAHGSTAGPSTTPVGIDASGDTLDIGAATISHWRGSVFVPHITVGDVLHRLEWPGTPPPQDDVAASRVLAREPGRLRVYMRLVRHAIVTVTYDTEHEMTFEPRSPALATARSVATRIDEVGGGDHGFLWRLNSYWRYEQSGDGVLISVESLTLSRDVPMLIKPIAGRIVPRIARESMVRTLEALGKYLRERTGN